MRTDKSSVEDSDQWTWFFWIVVILEDMFIVLVVASFFLSIPLAESSV